MTLKILFINLLTLIRVIGTIIIVPIYKIYGGFLAGIISLICYLTDSIDGFLARKWQASTFFGAFFDGAADKMLTLANFILLYLITPYALIPIIIELLIIIVQYIKYLKHLNIKSNIIGKCKVWVLAICVVLTFFASDINNISFLSINFKNYILNMNAFSKLAFYLLLPAIIMEVLTLFSYILESFNAKNLIIKSTNTKEIELPQLGNKTKWEKFKVVWLNPHFYSQHKDDSNLQKLTKI